MFSKWLQAAAGGLLAALCAASAQAADAAASAAPARTTITVATFPDLDRAAKAALPRWQALHPQVDVKIVSLQYTDHHPAMIAALATGAGLPDVMALDLRYIAKFAASRGLLPLDGAPLHAEALAPRFTPFAYAQGRSAEGRQVALPTDIGPGTLLYRHDLIAKAGLTEADLTRSWESFIDAGRKLKAATGAYLLADAADVRDIVLRSGLKDGEGLYFDRDGRVLVDGPRFRRAFTLAKAAREAGIDARAQQWTNEWVAGFRRHRIAGQMMGSWLAGQLKNWLAPDTAGLWRSTVLPGGTAASYGGSFYAIPKQARHPAEAWAFIRFMTDDAQTQLGTLKLLDAFPALLEAQQDPVIDEPIPFLGGQRARQLWRDIATQVPAIPVHRLDALATDVIRFEYEEVIAQGKDIDRALADARELIERRARRLRPAPRG